MTWCPRTVTGRRRREVGKTIEFPARVVLATGTSEGSEIGGRVAVEIGHGA